MEPIQPAIGMMMSVVMMMDMVVTTNQILTAIEVTLEGVDFGPGEYKNAFCPNIIDPVQGNSDVDINHYDKSIIYSSWNLHESKFDKGWRSCAMLTGKERHRKRREGVNRSQGCKY